VASALLHDVSHELTNRDIAYWDINSQIVWKCSSLWVVKDPRAYEPKAGLPYNFASEELFEVGAQLTVLKSDILRIQAKPPL
jgi:hypothetical protein